MINSDYITIIIFEEIKVNFEGQHEDKDYRIAFTNE